MDVAYARIHLGFRGEEINHIIIPGKMCLLGNFAYLCPSLPLTVFRRGIVVLRYRWSSPAGLAFLRKLLAINLL